jgi:hypothetical protein
MASTTRRRAMISREVGRQRVLSCGPQNKFLKDKACKHIGSTFNRTVDHMVEDHLNRRDPRKCAIAQVFCRTCYWIKDHDRSMWF